MSSVTDPRYIDVLAVLSRHGVRLHPDRFAPLIRDLLEVLEQPTSPVEGRSADGYKALHHVGLQETWRPAAGYRTRGKVAAKNPAPGLRICKHCQQALPLERFGFNNDPRTGRRRPKTSCRECLAKRQRERDQRKAVA